MDTHGHRTGIAGLILCFAMVDLLLPIAMSRVVGIGWPMVPAAMLGVVIGEFYVISIWAAISTGSLVIRIPLALLLMFSMDAALAIGVSPLNIPVDFSPMVEVLAVQCLVQVPLWLVIKYFGWRLGAPDAEESGGQFSISQLLIATALMALLFGLTRQALTDARVWGSDSFWLTIGFWGGAATVNLLFVIPSALAAVQPYDKLGHWVRGCGILVVAVTTVGVLLVGLIGGLAESSRLIGWILLTVNISQCCTIMGTLLLLRSFGYRVYQKGQAPLPASS